MKSPQLLVIVTIGVMFVFVIAGTVAIAIAVPEGARAASLIALLIGQLPPTIAVLVTLAKVGSIADRQREISGQVTNLANGYGDDKIQRNVHVALDERRTALDTRLDDAHTRAGVQRGREIAADLAAYERAAGRHEAAPSTDPAPTEENQS